MSSPRLSCEHIVSCPLSTKPMLILRKWFSFWKRWIREHVSVHKTAGGLKPHWDNKERAEWGFGVGASSNPVTMSAASTLKGGYIFQGICFNKEPMAELFLAVLCYFFFFLILLDQVMPQFDSHCAEEKAENAWLCVACFHLRCQHRWCPTCQLPSEKLHIKDANKDGADGRWLRQQPRTWGHHVCALVSHPRCI